MFESLFGNEYCYENLKEADKRIANTYIDAIEEVESCDYECDMPKTLEKIALEIAGDYKKQILNRLEQRLEDFYIWKIDSYKE